MAMGSATLRSAFETEQGRAGQGTGPPQATPKPPQSHPQVHQSAGACNSGAQAVACAWCGVLMQGGGSSGWAVLPSVPRVTPV